jgi:hypothetical protein
MTLKPKGIKKRKKQKADINKVENVAVIENIKESKSFFNQVESASQTPDSQIIDPQNKVTLWDILISEVSESNQEKHEIDNRVSNFFKAPRQLERVSFLFN